MEKTEWEDRSEDPAGLGRVLVTGATGFVGGYLARALVARGVQARLMVRRRERGRLLEPLGAELVYGDLLRPASLERALQGVDTVFHLGARATFERYERLRPTIVEGSGALMQAARGAGVRRFVFASSLLVYGGTEPGSDAMIDAATPVRPRIGYGRAKVEAEALLQREAPQDMKLAIIRLPHVYGAKSFLFEQLKRSFLVFPGPGDNRYSHLHADDAAALLIEVAVRGWTGVAPVADQQPASWNEFFAVLDQHWSRLQLLKLPAPLAIAGASLLEMALAWRRAPSLYTGDTVRGWLLDLPVRPGLVWEDLGLKPRHPSITTGIPASLDEAVSFRWLHPLLDRSRG